MKLPPCPDLPICVSSQSNDPKHFIEPFPYKGSFERTREALLVVIESMKHSTIVTAKEDYIRAEFRSALFRFVDVFECCIDDVERVVHVRSSSRMGFYDLGVNRRRVEEMRIRYEK
jgi:uncharacterized protein (DUF1499 family)